jgi:hypothetical protein
MVVLLVAGAILFAAETQSRGEVVVAIRYLQPKGVSHAHLYLYADSGKLLRQLTKDNSGQDFDPLFAPDGKTILFSRELREGVVETWAVKPDGSGVRRLDPPPEWYTSTRSSPFFTNFIQTDAATGEEFVEAPALDNETPRIYRAPDGSVEVLPRRLSTEPDDDTNGEGTGRHSLLRDLKTGRELEMGTLPGFVGVWDVLRLGGTDRAYLLEDELRVIFFGIHLNSTDGDTLSALDLNKLRFRRLSPNWATPIPLPGEPAFLTFTYNRYVPIAGSKMTANCTYLERWDAELNKVRYARAGAAAICYGASVFRPGRAPATVNIRRDGN